MVTIDRTRLEANESYVIHDMASRITSPVMMALMKGMGFNRWYRVKKLINITSLKTCYARYKDLLIEDVGEENSDLIDKIFEPRNIDEDEDLYNSLLNLSGKDEKQLGDRMQKILTAANKFRFGERLTNLSIDLIELIKFNTGNES